MKRSFAIFVSAVLLAGCDRKSTSAPPPPPPPKYEGLKEIETPVATAPPVQTAPYENGYRAGDAAGEASAKALKIEHPRTPIEPPSKDELHVLALAAAGTDPTRAEKWQRGYAAGYRDGFVRIVEGKR